MGSEMCIRDSPRSISQIPHKIIHGANDLICPIEPILEFARRGNLVLEALPDTGHNGLAEPMIAAIRRALEDLNC